MHWSRRWRIFPHVSHLFARVWLLSWKSLSWGMVARDCARGASNPVGFVEDTVLADTVVFDDDVDDCFSIVAPLKNLFPFIACAAAKS